MDKETANRIIAQLATDYNTIAEHFSDTRQQQWGAVRALVEQFVQPHHRVLDLGCGNGRVAELVTKIKASYVGMDASEQLIQIAREQYPDNEFHVGNMMELPFDDASFDIIVMIASFHHIPGHDYRIQTLEGCRRVLRPGGKIIMTNWDLRHQKKYAGIRRRLHLQKIFGKSQMDWNDYLIPWRTGDGEELAQRYYHGFSQNEIESLAQATQLQPLSDPITAQDPYNIITVLQKHTDS